MAGRRQRAAVLIAVPAVEDHTIGAVVAAGRLRRKGFQVGLSMKDSDDHLLRKLEDDAVDSLFLSWSTTAVTDKLAGLVGRIRNASGCKVILGGSALADPVADPWHIAADHVTADIAAALVIAQARHDGGGPADAGDAPQQSSEGTRP
jgi:methylmalonyl-CoA mutase cobalamin-binding subunit